MGIDARELAGITMDLVLSCRIYFDKEPDLVVCDILI